MMDYAQFLESKRIESAPSGLSDIPPLNPMLFPFQRDIVKWALRRGRAAIFADCGLGKTPMQLEWARRVCEATGGNVLILAPLAVADQTIREGAKFSVSVLYCRHQSEVKPGITIANYEMLEHFDASSFIGVVLDESSIMKAFMGKTKQAILKAFACTPYRLACTATPAPNDHLELGNHAEFLGIMPSNEMIARWFVNDSMHVGHYRLKGHAAADFWRWMASWAVCISKPSDIGYEDDGFILPPLTINEVIVGVDYKDYYAEGSFLPEASLNATSLHREMRRTTQVRAEEAARLDSLADGFCINWCNTNYEADELRRAMPQSLEVRGNEPHEVKAAKLLAFSLGEHRSIITKPSIAGFGLNWQHCHIMNFVGLSYSYEMLYQAICRAYRFGQTHPVTANIIVAESETGVLETINRKREAHRQMQAEMVGAMREIEMENINPDAPRKLTNSAGDEQVIIPDWMVA